MNNLYREVLEMAPGECKMLKHKRGARMDREDFKRVQAALLRDRGVFVALKNTTYGYFLCRVREDAANLSPQWLVRE